MVYASPAPRQPEPTSDDFQQYGVPQFARLEIPVRTPRTLREYAAALRDLADQLDRVSRDQETAPLFLALRAVSEVRFANGRLQQIKSRHQRISTDTPGES